MEVRSSRIVILVVISMFLLPIVMFLLSSTVNYASASSNTGCNFFEEAWIYTTDICNKNTIATLTDESSKVLPTGLGNVTGFSKIELDEEGLKGPVGYLLVFDSLTDEPQHRYIYLGILPEDSSADCSASQSKIFRVGIGDIVLFFMDAEGRPLENVHVVFDEWGIEGYTGKSGSLRFEKMPRISYMITAEWLSKYGSRALTKVFVKGDSTITMPVYDVTLQVLTSKGNPIANADIWLENTYLGVTNREGKILAAQVPIGSYSVSAKWLDSNLILQKLNVTTGGEIILTPSNVHSLTVMVRGAMGQALEGASVTIWKDSAELLRRITDKSGNVEVELPDGEYVIEVSFDQFQKRKSLTLRTDSFERIDLDVFIKVLGVSMTLSQTILSVLGIIVMIFLLAVIIHEYHIYRRKKLPQLFIVRKIE